LIIVPDRKANKVKLLKGRKIAEKILKETAREIKKKKSKPGLAVILVGKDKASEIYVKLKKEKSEKIGIDFHLFRFKESDPEKKILEKIIELNGNQKIDGIIIQLPLPEKFHTQKLINAISLKKDVDGFHPKSVDLFFKNKEIFFPVFPQAIFSLVKSAGKNIKNRKAIIIANSKLFGEMMVKTLSREKVQAAYIFKKDLKINLGKIKRADIVITAVGSPGIVKGDMVKNGVIVVDGGISKKGSKVSGDADADSFRNISGFLSPVPGGAGPVTVACLLKNVSESFKNRSAK